MCLAEGFQSEQNIEKGIPALCEHLKPFTLGEISIKYKRQEIKPLGIYKLNII